MAETSVTFKRRKRTTPTASSATSSNGLSAPQHHPLSAFHWIQRLRDAERNPVSAEVKTPELVQCIVLFPDQSAVVVERVSLANISSLLWGVDPSKDKDMLHPLDLDNRVLAEPIRDDSVDHVRQGVFMSYNNHASNRYEVNVAATRILADGGLLELGCVPAIRLSDEPKVETVDGFFNRVLKHCTTLCPRGPVVFFLADITNVGKEGPIPLPFSSTYFNQVYPMLFRQDKPYNRMLSKYPPFATRDRSIETLLTLNGSTARGGQFRYISREAARSCRETLLRDVWGHSDARIRSLVKTQLEEAEFHATICVLIHEFTMGKWQHVTRVPVVR